MKRRRLISNGAIVVFLAILIGGLVLMAPDVLVILHGKLANATVLTAADQQCNVLPHIRYIDDGGNVHMVTSYDIAGCPHNLQPGQSIRIWYLSGTPTRILLAQDRNALIGIFSILGVMYIFILLVIGLLVRIAIRKKVTPGEILDELFVRPYLAHYKRPQRQ